MNLTAATRIAQLSLILILSFNGSFSWAAGSSDSLEEPSTEVQPLESLPAEVMQMILDQLNPSDLARVSAVSKDFQQVTEFQWKTFCKILVRLSASDSDEMAVFQEEFDALRPSITDQKDWKWKDLFILLVKLQVTRSDLEKGLTPTNPLSHQSKREITQYVSRALARKGATLSLQTLPGTIKGNLDAVSFETVIGFLALVSSYLALGVATQEIPPDYFNLGICGAVVSGIGAGTLGIYHYFNPVLTQLVNTQNERDQQEILRRFKAAVLQEFRDRFNFVPSFASMIAERQ
jgi:hypothetical protein